ncbi:hypothetical protein [Ferrovibrio terrae]|uniref:hypothetical protein n=1 Tax=Ferrovibrio terrae TaxID=2594003 RepID=UPI003137931A
MAPDATAKAVAAPAAGAVIFISATGRGGEPARFGRHANASTPIWSNYTAVFGYVLKIVDGKVIIEDYRYISKT